MKYEEAGRIVRVGSPALSAPSGPSVAEEALIRAAQQRDESAVEALYTRHVDQVYRYLYARLGVAEDSEDLTAEVFLRMLRSLPSYRIGGAPFASWLFRIAHNCLVDHWRGLKGRRNEDLGEASAASTADPAAEVETRAALQELAAALRTLPPAQREVLALRFSSDLSVAEIAQSLGKREGTVRVLQHKGLAALRSRCRQVPEPPLRRAKEPG